MPWIAPAIGAVGAIGSALIGNSSKAPSAPQPYAVQGVGGSAAWGERAGMYSQGTDAASVQRGTYNNLNQQFLGQAGAAPSGAVNLNPAEFMDAGRSTAISDPWAQKGADLFGQGMGVLDSFKNFNPDTFAADQYARLSRIAAPGEDSAARLTAQRLFGGGRLGGSDVASKDMFGRLAESQSRANDARALSAIGMAGDEQTRLLNTGLGLTQQGMQTTGFGDTLQTSSLQRMLSGAGGAQGVGGYNMNYINSLLGAANNTQAGAYNAGQDQRDAMQIALQGQGLATGAAGDAAKIGYLQNQNLGDIVGKGAGTIVDALGGLKPTTYGSPANKQAGSIDSFLGQF